MEPTGTLTVELEHTLYRDPTMLLVAVDSQGNHVPQAITIEWPCKYDYFFAPAPEACPADEAYSGWAAERPFENGRMIWLEEVRPLGRSVILVFYNDGRYERYQARMGPRWTLGEIFTIIVEPLDKAIVQFAVNSRHRAIVETEKPWSQK